MSTQEPKLRWIDSYRVEEGNIRLHGRYLESTHQCRRFFQQKLRGKVREALTTSRLADELDEHVNSLESTGFGAAEIRRVAENNVDPAPWQIGEVLAQLLLEETEFAKFPWPPSWDNRIGTASAGGSDIVGFIENDGAEEFVFGETKTSEANDVHSSVIYGDLGLRKQVQQLIESERRRVELIGWLLVRTRDSQWKSIFSRAVNSYCSNPENACVVGVLLRSKDRDMSHLEPVKKIVQKAKKAFTVALLAFYLPIHADNWLESLEGTEDLP